LNACGHDHASFQSIIELFEPIYDSHYLNEYTGFLEPVSTTRTGKRKEDQDTWMLKGVLALS
jgi:hypothetical protein